MKPTYTVEQGYRQYYFYMLRIANVYAGINAEDVVQEVAISMLKKEREQGPQFETHNNFRRFVSVAVKNAAMDVAKVQGKRRVLNLKYLSENWIPDPIERDSVELKKREDYTNYIYKKHIVERAMQYLPLSELKAIELRFMDKRNPEIAEAMHINVQSAKNYLQRAIKRIQRFMVDDKYWARLIRLRGKVDRELAEKGT